MPSLEELDDSDSNGSMSSPMDSESGGGGTGRPRVGACMDDQDEGGEGDEVRGSRWRKRFHLLGSLSPSLFSSGSGR